MVNTFYGKENKQRKYRYFSETNNLTERSPKQTLRVSVRDQGFINSQEYKLFKTIL